jgi:hypothetical protein
MTLALAIIVVLAMLLFVAATGSFRRAEPSSETVSVTAAVRPRRRPF